MKVVFSLPKLVLKEFVGGEGATTGVVLTVEATAHPAFEDVIDALRTDEWKRGIGRWRNAGSLHAQHNSAAVCVCEDAAFLCCIRWFSVRIQVSTGEIGSSQNL